MTNIVEDSSCSSINLDPHSTSLSGQDCLSMKAQESTDKIEGLSDALVRIYSERKLIFEEEKIFGKKDESRFLLKSIQEMESSYKHLIPKFGFGFGTSIVAKSISLSGSAYQALRMLDMDREINLREINKTENDFDSDIFVRMPPLKKFTKKAKTRRITQAVPNFILEED